jgi:hypothetical protein
MRRKVQASYGSMKASLVPGNPTHEDQEQNHHSEKQVVSPPQVLPPNPFWIYTFNSVHDQLRYFLNGCC